VALTSPCLQQTSITRADAGDTEYQHLASSIEQPLIKVLDIGHNIWYNYVQGDFMQTNPTLKTCTKCLCELSVDLFYKKIRRYTSRTTGETSVRETLRPICIQCYSKKQQEAWAINPEKREKQKRRGFLHLLKKYGLTEQDYLNDRDKQKNKCAICDSPPKEDAYHPRLYIDHNHTTGLYRALLCHNCNALLGHCQENILILEKSIVYLNKHGVSRHRDKS
jgi:hypothetical protein